jgi:hypothetical protein
MDILKMADMNCSGQEILAVLKQNNQTSFL